MEKQEIFDKVVIHIFTQDQRAYTGHTCQYKTDDGLKCAVGCLIPDELYNKKLEGSGINGLKTDRENPRAHRYEVARALPDWMFEPTTQILLSALQNVHDTQENWDTTEKMQNMLNMIANIFDLNSVKMFDYRFKDR